MADIVIGAIAAEVFIDSVAVTALADASIGAFAIAAADGVAGELASTFVGDFLGTASNAVGSAATGEAAATTAQGLTGAAEESATAATQAAENANISTNAAKTAGVADNAAEAIQQAKAADTSIYTGAQPTTTPNPIPDQTIPPKDPSVWEKASDWLKENKTIATAGGQVLGGIGKGLLESQTMGKKIAADKEIAQNKTAWDLQAKRDNMASSGAFNQNLGFSAPGQPRMLRRPDGSVVYASPGIIAGQMKP